MKSVLSLLFFAALSSMVFAGQVLNGLAVHTSFGSDEFIAALHTENFSSKPEEILNPTTFSRMEMRIVADRISKRKFINLWVQSIVINNRPNEQNKQRGNIEKFKSFFKDNLLKGDKIVIEWSKEKHTNIYVNNIHLGTIPDKNFYLMLLRGWIGLVPLSSDFRADLLSIDGINRDRLEYYGKILPSPERIEEIESWKTEEIKDNQNPITQSKNIKIANTKKLEVNAVPKPELPPPPAPKKEAPDKKAPSHTPEPKSEPYPKSPPNSEENTLVASSQKSVDQGNIEDKKVEEPIPPKVDWDWNKYYKNMMKRIRNTGIKYPPKAKEKGQEDVIKLSVWLDYDGKPTFIGLERHSQYPLLEEAAADLIQRAAPYGKIPLGVPESDRSFPMSIKFNITR